MPKISQRGLHMPLSPIRKLVPYSEDAKKKGKIVYHLNIGQPDIPTAPLMIEAIKKKIESSTPFRQLSSAMESIQPGS